MQLYYKLDGHTPVPCTPEEGLALLEDGVARSVAKTEIEPGVRVSTVFLCIDHNFLGSGPPLLFETMIFGGPLDGYQDRYCTWDEAVAGHELAVKRARAGTEDVKVD